MLGRQKMRNSIPSRTALILAAIASALMLLAIGINYFRGGGINYFHVLLALGLVAFVVWFSGRSDDAG